MTVSILGKGTKVERQNDNHFYNNAEDPSVQVVGNNKRTKLKCLNEPKISIPDGPITPKRKITQKTCGPKGKMP